jgi:hypothetical protein
VNVGPGGPFGGAIGDPVVDWKHVVRQRLRDEALVRGGRPPLRVTISFGLIVLVTLIGLTSGVRGLWTSVALVFTALLAQELPRAVLARRFGRSSRIVLTPFGSETEISGEPPRGLSAVAWAISGSVVNLAVAAAAFGLARRGAPAPAVPLLEALALCHAAWGFAQVLPVRPFRGHALVPAFPPRLRLAVVLTTLLLLARLGSIAAESANIPALFALLAIAVAASVRAVLDLYRDLWDLTAEVEKIAREADARLDAGDPGPAVEQARRALGLARSESLRIRLWRTLAWAGISKHDPLLAHAGLIGMRPEYPDLHLLAAYLACCNRLDEAVELLEQARGSGQRGAETSKLLIDLLFRRGNVDAALAVARADEALLSPKDQQAIERALASAHPPDTGSSTATDSPT